MKHKIFFFTGTGNSLWVARVLSSRLGKSEIIPILKPSMDAIKESETIGVVFPVYMHRVPYLVADLIKALPELNYLYAVAVNAGDTGQAFSYFRKQLSAGPNNLKAGFSIFHVDVKTTVCGLLRRGEYSPALPILQHRAAHP